MNPTATQPTGPVYAVTTNEMVMNATTSSPNKKADTPVANHSTFALSAPVVVPKAFTACGRQSESALAKKDVNASASTKKSQEREMRYWMVRELKPKLWKGATGDLMMLVKVMEAPRMETPVMVRKKFSK